jgi:hypothetical protein
MTTLNAITYSAVALIVVMFMVMITAPVSAGML